MANATRHLLSESPYDEDVETYSPLRKKSGPIQYPTKKPTHYSKDRRYVQIPKKSDETKKTIKSSQGKGAKHKKSPKNV